MSKTARSDHSEFPLFWQGNINGDIWKTGPRDLTYSNGIQQLRFRQPMPTLDQIRANESQENVSASIKHRANFEEEKKQ